MRAPCVATAPSPSWMEVDVGTGGNPMAMPQRDNYIEQIHRLEGLIAFAEEQKDWDEVERLKEQLRRLLERM